MDLSNLLGGQKYVFTPAETHALTEAFENGQYMDFINTILARERLNHTINMEVASMAEALNYLTEELRELYSARVGEKEFLSTLQATQDNIAAVAPVAPANHRYFFYSAEFKEFRQRQEALGLLMEKYTQYLERYTEGYRYSLDFLNPETHEIKSRFYKTGRALAVDLIQTYRLDIEIQRSAPQEKI